MDSFIRRFLKQKFADMTVNDYNKCVEEVADNVYRFILKNIKNEEKAHDIVQDAFEKLWLNHEDVDDKKAHSYLFSTAYHRMIDVIRYESRQEPFENKGYNEPSHSSQYNDLKEILDQAVERLPEKQKAVLMLRDYEGYSYNEIAEITNLTESQVKVYIYRARVFLKKYIGRLETVI